MGFLFSDKQKRILNALEKKFGKEIDIQKFKPWLGDENLSVENMDYFHKIMQSVNKNELGEMDDHGFMPLVYGNINMDEDFFYLVLVGSEIIQKFKKNYQKQYLIETKFKKYIRKDREHNSLPSLS